MKTILLTIFLVSWPLPRLVQVPSTPEEIIRREIDSGILEGFDARVVGPMGDDAAVAVTKVVAGRSLRPDQINTVLEILKASFADPRLVPNLAAREPRTALFVLHSLSEETRDQALKASMAETRQYVLTHYNDYKAIP